MQRHNGFSLLEILVAFAIMAVALTIVLRIFGAGVNTALVSEDYTLATQIAESLLARVGADIPLQVGQLNGVEGEKYRWRLGVDPLPPLVDSRSSARKDDQQATPRMERYRVIVNVAWGDDARQLRSVELDTLKLRMTERP